MRNDRLENMVKGWFIGDFSPNVHFSKDCEVAVKHYKAGDEEILHYHKVATELTVVVSGKVKMLGTTWVEGDIIKLDPGEKTDFFSITDSVTVVVKTPSVSGDKYEVKD